jgi:hypothetical protein
VDTTAGPSCGTVTWQVSGQLSNGTFDVTASDPSPTQDQCGNQATGTNNEQITLSGSCSQGSSSWSSSFASGTSSWAGQVPTSLRVVSSRALSTEENAARGCEPGFVGFYIRINYQLLDQTSRSIKVAGLVPQEQILAWTVNTGGMKFGPKDPLPYFADITKGMTTDANGQFSDHPFGPCSTGPDSETSSDIQNIRIVNPKNKGVPRTC